MTGLSRIARFDLKCTATKRGVQSYSRKILHNPAILLILSKNRCERPWGIRLAHALKKGDQDDPPPVKALGG